MKRLRLVPPRLLIYGAGVVAVVVVCTVFSYSPVDSARAFGEYVYEFFRALHLIRVDQPISREVPELGPRVEGPTVFRPAPDGAPPDRNGVGNATLKATEMTERDWRRVRVSLIEEEPLLTFLREDSATYGVHQPDYLRSAPDDVFGLGPPAPEAIQERVAEELAAALRLFEQGDAASALRAAADAAQTAHTWEIAPLDVLNANALSLDMVVDAWWAMAGTLRDPSALRAQLRTISHALISLEGARSDLPGPVMRAILSKVDGIPRERLREALASEDPEDLVRAFVASRAEALEKRLSQGAEDPDLRERLVARIEREADELRSAMKQETLIGWDWSLGAPDRDPAANSVAWHPTAVAEAAAQARLQLLCAQTAERYWTRRAEMRPGDPQVESVFEEGLTGITATAMSGPPIDPFAREPMRYDEATRRIYSVGPDGKDDGGRLLYDPTNGTYSAGDIFLLGAARPVEEIRRRFEAAAAKPGLRRPGPVADENAASSGTLPAAPGAD